jgi:hypothetical protein
MRRWLRRRWRRGRRWLTQQLEAWRDARFERAAWQRIHAQEARERMQEADATKLALARSMLEQLGPEYREALKAVAAEEVREAAREEALALARQELEATVARRRERLEAEKAAYQARLDREYETRAEETRTRARHQARQDVEAELEEARTTAAQALDAQQQLEGPLVALVRALLPEGRKIYVGRYGIPEVDVFGLNRVLRHQGVEIQHDLPSRDQPEIQEFPELLVKVRTGEAHYGSATRFWLAKVEPATEPVDPVTGIPLKNIVRVT